MKITVWDRIWSALSGVLIVLAGLWLLGLVFVVQPTWLEAVWMSAPLTWWQRAVTVNALQKQIKQYITSCSGVDVHKVRVMVETDARAASDTDVQSAADAPIPTAAAPLAEGIEEPIFRHVEEAASYAVSDGEQPDGSRETEVQPDAVPGAPANEREEDESAPDAPARREATAVESVEGEENA